MNSFEPVPNFHNLSKTLILTFLASASYVFCLDTAVVFAGPTAAASSSTHTSSSTSTPTPTHTFRQTNPKNGSRAEAALNAARDLANSERYDEANLMLDKILRDDPKNVKALCTRALCSTGVGNEEAAIKDLSQAIAIDPKCAAAYRNRAKNWCVLGKNDLAKADITKAIELDPGDASAQEDAGYILANMNEYQKAVDAFSKALSLNSHRLVIRRKRAMALTHLGHIDQAIADYEYCIAHEKTNQEAYFLKANIYEKQGQFAKVADVYRALYQAKPSRLDSLQKLAVALVKAKLFDEALIACDKLISVSPDDDELYVLRARCYLGKQIPAKALKDLERALALMGKGNKEVYQLRAQAHRSLGDARLANQDEVELKHLQN